MKVNSLALNTSIFKDSVGKAGNFRFKFPIPHSQQSNARGLLGNVQRGGGGISSVETTRLARMETHHDFLAHGDLLRVSLYGRQG